MKDAVDCSSMTLIDSLHWRHATKKFDAQKKVSDADVSAVLEAARLAPSSYGLQPWKFLVITDPVIRAALREKAWNQDQVTDASHLIVLCAKIKLDEKDVEHYIKAIADTRGLPVDALAGFNDMMLGSIGRQSADQMKTWNQKQVYIALGMLLAACAEKQIDSCPMEGFDAAGFDELLGLTKDNLTATVLCPIGYRAADEVAPKKVRFCAEEVIERR